VDELKRQFSGRQKSRSPEVITTSTTAATTTTTTITNAATASATASASASASATATATASSKPANHTVNVGTNQIQGSASAIAKLSAAVAQQVSLEGKCEVFVSEKSLSRNRGHTLVLVK
jgi:uncharacterized membrane protein